MLRISATLTEGESECLLLCPRPASIEACRDHLLSNELGSLDEVSPVSSSPYTILLNRRKIEILLLESRTVSLHVLETKVLNLRTPILTCSPNWPSSWDASPTAGNDRGVKLVIGVEFYQVCIARGLNETLTT